MMKTKGYLFSGLILGALLLSAGVVLAQSGEGASTALVTGFDLTWWTVDGGGGTVSGGAYELSGTIGQPDAGVLSGGGYTLAGGFWSGGPPRHKLYLPIIMKNHMAW